MNVIIIIMDLFFYENARQINGYLFFFITFIKKLDHFEGNNYYRVKIDVYLKKN